MSYDSIIETAKRLIKKKGHTVVYRNYTSIDNVDDNKPWLGNNAKNSVDYDVFAVFLPISRIGKRTSELRDDSIVKTLNLKCIIANVSFIPTVSDVIIRDGSILEIVNIYILKPADDDIIYQMELKS